MAASRARTGRWIPGVVERTLDTALDKALSVQRPVVQAYVTRMRSRHPDAGPAEVIAALERHYRTVVVGIGGASGGAAALPGVGTGASIASGAAEITAFVSATAMYVLALAEVHGVPVGDAQVRRAMVLTVLVGDAAGAVIDGVAHEAPHWAQVLGRPAQKEKIAGINVRLTRLLVTRFGARQGVLLVGRALPLGLGAGVGALGNAALARAAIGSARRLFGPPPARFAPRVIDVAPPAVGPPPSTPTG